MIINKIIAVEGLDKTGKSTFCNSFETIFNTMLGINNQLLVKKSFPDSLSPIGKLIRSELITTAPNTNIVSTPNFLADMSHFWMQELFNNASLTRAVENNKRENIIPNNQLINKNYIFDRYFISTLAYQAFLKNSALDLEFINMALNTNKFLKMPTDIILLDLPNDKIIERTIEDKNNGLNDANDTLDVELINSRRLAYKKAVNHLSKMGINIHWIEDSSLYNIDDLVKILIGKIFK